MIISPAGLQLVQSWEGIAGRTSTGLFGPYFDVAGLATCGYGHLLYDARGQRICSKTLGEVAAMSAATAAMVRTIGVAAMTQDQAVALLHKDMAVVETELSKHVGASTAQCEFDAICAFAFNVGWEGAVGSTLMSLHNAGKRATGQLTVEQLATFSQSPGHTSPTTVPEAFVAWSYSRGAWVKGLFRRRVSEALVYDGTDPATAYQLAEAFNA